MVIQVTESGHREDDRGDAADGDHGTSEATPDKAGHAVTSRVGGTAEGQPRLLSLREVKSLLAGGARYRRTGEVEAERLGRDTDWTTVRGDPMSGAPGDWLVTDEVTTWVVADELFRLRYVAAGPGTYLRNGTIRAAPLCEDVRLLTREGTATGARGDWVATGDEDDVWVISAEHFAVAYVLEETAD